MQILLSNDDGVHAFGLSILAETLSSFATIHVMAPDRDRSGASNSLTLDLPLRIQTLPNGFHSVNGTPTDCVHIAITGFLSETLDMVVSGINAGANLGDDVLYSGTVAAAMEGRFLGYPAIAISLVNLNKQACRNFDTAAQIVRLIIERIKKDPLPKETILNINVPDLPLKQIKGIKVTRLGHRHLAEKVIPGKDPRGRTIYWVGPAGPEQDAGPGTDFHAINEGYVSITPINIDLTDYKSIENIATWSSNLNI